MLFGTTVVENRVDGNGTVFVSDSKGKVQLAEELKKRGMNVELLYKGYMRVSEKTDAASHYGSRPAGGASAETQKMVVENQNEENGNANASIESITSNKKIIIFLSRHTDNTESQRVESIARKILDTADSLTIAFEGYSDNATKILFENLDKLDYAFLAANSPFPEWYSSMLGVFSNLEKKYGSKIKVVPMDVPDTMLSDLVKLPQAEKEYKRNQVIAENIKQSLKDIDKKNILLIVFGGMHGLYLNDWIRKNAGFSNSDIGIVNMNDHVGGLYNIYRKRDSAPST